MKLRLKIRPMQKTDKNPENLTFKDYFSGLSDDEKSEIRDLFITRKYMAYSTFYQKVEKNSWSVLEFEKLEEITGKKFEK